MSLFSGMGKAKMWESGVWLSPGGHYECKVDRILIKNTRKGKKLFMVELIVTKSDNAKDPVGAKRTWSQDMNADSAWASIKNFLYALLGFSWATDQGYLKAMDVEGEKIEAIAEESVTDAQPLKGVPVAIETLSVKTKANTDFTRHDFSPLREKQTAVFDS
jgi:hypothetical protein